MAGLASGGEGRQPGLSRSLTSSGSDGDGWFRHHPQLNRSCSTEGATGRQPRASAAPPWVTDGHKYPCSPERATGAPGVIPSPLQGERMVFVFSYPRAALRAAGASLRLPWAIVRSAFQACTRRHLGCGSEKRNAYLPIRSLGVTRR